MSLQRTVFTIAVTCIGRAALARDFLLGRLHAMRRQARAGRQPVSRQFISSKDRLLDSAYVRPVDGQPKAVLLICHGSGETVEYWIPVQQLLAEHGVASLVFDYSGYGRSHGPADWNHFEQDAVAAFEYLKALHPAMPVSLLGFSMGSGVATAVLYRTQPDRLVLCAAFTSFREAACSLGVPRCCAAVLPAIWSGEAALCSFDRPVLIVHGERDRKFPLRMANQLASWCRGSADLVVVPGHTHNEPFYRPQWTYWGEVVKWLLENRPSL